MRFIDPLADLGAALLQVEKPGRCTGGEYGSRARREDLERPSELTALIAFPDLYEIGMSNQALRILYNRLNDLEGITCDRAFAPAPDFEALLRQRGLPLYGLDTGICLRDLDLLLFTLGYELGFTGVLDILDLGGIPLRRRNRGEGDPIVILGGPCGSNPLPFGDFIDAFWIGEAEAGFFDLAARLRDLKRAGARREDLLACLGDHPSVWMEGKPRAIRAVAGDFSSCSYGEGAPVFPVPNLKVVHPHGSVEIMRGCPNGCRFCHAGFWYRPMRQKDPGAILREVRDLVDRGGYQEISLSSLSSGDYEGIEALVDSLNREFGPRHVSFQLPSLRVSSFSLPLLEKISAVRKSGLTFAVETPGGQVSINGQFSINKEVSQGSVVDILKEAKKQGWRGAKFYFMIGLPLEGQGGEQEEEEIVRFVLDTAVAAGMHFHVQVGAFVPKPHTPYETVPQIGEEAAWKKIHHIQDRLKPRGHRVSIQDPFLSVLEGIISRGEGRVGGLLEEAFVRGCRLDAWTEYLRKDIWREILREHQPLVDSLLSARDLPPAWGCIESRVSPVYLARERARSKTGEMTLTCTEKCTVFDNKSREITLNSIKKCTDLCGVCGKEAGIRKNRPLEGRPPARAEEAAAGHDQAAGNDQAIGNDKKDKKDGTFKLLFSWSKTGRGVFYSHLSVMEMFFAAFTRAGVPVLYSEGFNPLPRLEIAAPLSLGIAGEGEIGAIEVASPCNADQFIEGMNRSLPEGLGVIRAMNFHIPRGAKKQSLSSVLAGYRYPGPAGPVFVPKEEEKAFRAGWAADHAPGLAAGCTSYDVQLKMGIFCPWGGTLYGLRRLEVLAARPGETGDREAVSYFALFGGLPPVISL